LAFRIAFKKSVSRDLKKIDEAQAGRILKKIKSDLPEKAQDLPGLTGKFSGLRKFGVGDYRVIFTIIEDTVLILRISHRQGIYR